MRKHWKSFNVWKIIFYDLIDARGSKFYLWSWFNKFRACLWKYFECFLGINSLIFLMRLMFEVCLETIQTFPSLLTIVWEASSFKRWTEVRCSFIDRQINVKTAKTESVILCNSLWRLYTTEKYKNTSAQVLLFIQLIIELHQTIIYSNNQEERKQSEMICARWDRKHSFPKLTRFSCFYLTNIICLRRQLSAQDMETVSVWTGLKNKKHKIDV